MNSNELITKKDLLEHEERLLKAIRDFVKETPDKKKWLRSADVRKLLGNISSGTLQNLRINGTLKYSKVGGTIFYEYEDIKALLESNKE